MFTELALLFSSLVEESLETLGLLDSKGSVLRRALYELEKKFPSMQIDKPEKVNLTELYFMIRDSNSPFSLHCCFDNSDGTLSYHVNGTGFWIVTKSIDQFLEAVEKKYYDCIVESL